MTGRVPTVVAGALAALLVSVAIAMAAVQTYLRAPIDDDGVLVLLLLGADEGPYRGGTPLSARADAFHLLTVSPDRQHATFVNFPRDSYVPVPGQGRTKINACLVSGPETCVATVEQNFGVDVDHYILTDFRGLAYGVEGLGGVTVDVEQRLYDPRGAESDLQPGTQSLSGPQALAYSRDRYSRSNGDFGRSEAQSKLLAAAHRQVVEDGAGVARVAELVGLVQQTTVTDAAPESLLRMAYAAASLPPSNVVNVTLPGNIGTAGAASVVHLPGRAHRIISDAADDGIIGSGS